MITFTALSNRKIVSQEYDHRILATRFASRGVPRGFAQLTELAPSRELWALARTLQQEGRWNRDSFVQLYTPRFWRELQKSDAARQRLAQLVVLSQQNRRLLVVCYCTDPQLCHRSLLYRALAPYTGCDLY